MPKLSEIHNAIGNYLYMHGDKDVTSIATWNGTSPIKYTLNLHDIYEGKVTGKGQQYFINKFLGKQELAVQE
jgi:hypothetical protein